MADFAMIRVPVFVAAINSNLLALWRMQNQKFCLETLWLSSKMKLVSRHNDDAIVGNQVVLRNIVNVINKESFAQINANVMAVKIANDRISSLKLNFKLLEK